ncbi:MAG: hypothetical protein ACYCXK_00045 [Candidatus Humimicrobiaceae bacterium]
MCRETTIKIKKVKSYLLLGFNNQNASLLSEFQKATLTGLPVDQLFF